MSHGIWDGDNGCDGVAIGMSQSQLAVRPPVFRIPGYIHHRYRENGRVRMHGRGMDIGDRGIDIGRDTSDDIVGIELWNGMEAATTRILRTSPTELDSAMPKTDN